MTAPIPFAPGAVRTYLISKSELTAMIPAAAITTREAPQKVSGPFMVIRATVNRGVDPMLRRPMMQIDVYTPKIEILGGTKDPDEVSWDIAAMAGQLLGKASNIMFRGSAWKGTWTEGPVTLVDQTRGVDNPLYRSMIRVEMKMRAPRD